MITLKSGWVMAPEAGLRRIWRTQGRPDLSVSMFNSGYVAIEASILAMEIPPFLLLQAHSIAMGTAAVRSVQPHGQKRCSGSCMPRMRPSTM